MPGFLDPYFDGQIEKKSPKPETLSSTKPRLLAWLSVYPANLIVPLILGWPMTHEAGRLGMLLGILAVFASGCYVCFVSRQAVLTVVYGGWLVAASQFFPFPQIVAGLMGIGAARSVGQVTSRGVGDLTGDLDGFIATIVTGGILLLVATVLGLVIRGMIAMFRPKSAASANPAS